VFTPEHQKSGKSGLFCTHDRRAVEIESRPFWAFFNTHSWMIVSEKNGLFGQVSKHSPVYKVGQKWPFCKLGFWRESGIKRLRLKTRRDFKAQLDCDGWPDPGGLIPAAPGRPMAAWRGQGRPECAEAAEAKRGLPLPASPEWPRS
jgi:hypothetical protein